MAYTRKTRDEYEIQGYYSHGWEMVTTEETRAEAKEQLKCYRKNEPGTAHRIIKRRVKIAAAPEMLEALELTDRFFKLLSKEDIVELVGYRNVKAVERAIAKAKGEQP